MSIRIMIEVWDHATVDGTELLMLLALADSADDATRTSWPSINRLAHKTRLSRRQAIRLLNNLIEAGLIQKRKRYNTVGDQTSNEYFFPVTAVTPGVTTVTPGVSPVSLGSVISVTPPVSSVSPGSDIHDTTPSDIHDTTPVSPVSPYPLSYPSVLNVSDSVGIPPTHPFKRISGHRS